MATNFNESMLENYGVLDFSEEVIEPVAEYYFIHGAADSPDGILENVTLTKLSMTTLDGLPITIMDISGDYIIPITASKNMSMVAFLSIVEENTLKRVTEMIQNSSEEAKKGSLTESQLLRKYPFYKHVVMASRRITNPFTVIARAVLWFVTFCLYKFSLNKTTLMMVPGVYDSGFREKCKIYVPESTINQVLIPLDSTELAGKLKNILK